MKRRSERMTWAIVTRFSPKLSKPHAKMFRVTSSAENSEQTMPTVSVMANPRTGPDESATRMTDVRIWVTCASKIGLKARR